MTIATTRRFPVVSHCTVDVVTDKSSIIRGNAIFNAVSVSRPQKEIRQAATIDIVSRIGTFCFVEFMININRPYYFVSCKM